MDKRLTPARPDLAASHLKGQVEAQRFVDGEAMQVTSSVTPIRRSPDMTGVQETQLLFGETFTVFETKDGWCWGQAAFDGYVGYVDAASLARDVVRNTHRVTSLSTFRYSKPDLKSPLIGHVPMNAKLQLGSDAGERFRREARGGWVFANHLAPLAESEASIVPLAKTFLGVPYLWGGRSNAGLDCSGLVQNVLERRGLVVPRDTDQQEAWCRENGATELFRRQRESDDWTGIALHPGDLVFWKGHVAIMIDSEDMIHANGTAMMVSIDDARGFSGRVATEAGQVQSIYRL